jgi:hypothetical protein
MSLEGGQPMNSNTDADRRAEFKALTDAIIAKLTQPEPGEYAFASSNRSYKTVEAVAYHEAAHAIVVVALGYRLISANIADGNPEIWHQGGIPFGDNSVIYLVGELAEGLPNRRIYRKSDAELVRYLREAWDYEPGENDLVKFFVSARREHSKSQPSIHFDTDTAIAAYRRAEEDALAFLEIPQHRMAIRAVADALLERGTLSGDEVREIACRYIDLSNIEKDVRNEFAA